MNNFKFKIIKIKYITKRVKAARIKWLIAELNVMKSCLRILNNLGGIAKNKEQEEDLRDSINIYDDCINRIEDEFISKIRMRLNNKYLTLDQKMQLNDIMQKFKDINKYNEVRTVKVYKEQFDAIEEKAHSIIITCKEDGRCLSFNRADDIIDEKSTDLISRNGLIKSFRKCYSGHVGMENSDNLMMFKSICSIINKEPSLGKMYEKEDIFTKWEYSEKENVAICKNCGYEHYLGSYHQYSTNYCPNCGAKNEGEYV